MALIVKTCNFNCTCSRQDCSFYHHIEDHDQRLKFKALYDSLYDKNEHNETDPDGVRKVSCKYGLLCNKEDCGFKHFCNFRGRILISKSWRKENKKHEVQVLIDEIKENKVTMEEITSRLEKMFPMKK